MWIKGKDQKPKPGDLVVIRNPTSSWSTDDSEEVIGWEYDAGIVKALEYGLYVEIAHDEYRAYIKDETEWQLLKE